MSKIVEMKAKSFKESFDIILENLKIIKEFQLLNIDDNHLIDDIEIKIKAIRKKYITDRPKCQDCGDDYRFLFNVHGRKRCSDCAELEGFTK